MAEHFFKNKKILITGASGFIGGHLLKKLAPLGCQVAVLTHQKKKTAVDAHVISGDLTVPESFSAAVKKWAPQIVFHLAAFKERKSDLAHFRQAIKVNLEGSLNLFEALEEAPLESVVVLGTGEEYGQNLPPYLEASREDPVNAYSWSKTALTHLCQLFFTSKKMPVTILRPGLAYGPKQSDDMFIPSLIRSLQKNVPFQMSLGEQTRDFIFIDDLINALLLAASQKKARGEIINIGQGIPVPLAEVALKIETFMNKENLIQMGKVPYRPREIMEYYMDLSKAKKLLNFTPKISLDQGLKLTVEAYAKEGR